MADVIYKKGQSSNLNNVQIKEGQVLVTEDTGEMYIDVTNSDRKKINEINLRNGSAEGSLRSINSKTEDDTYTIGTDATAEGSGTQASGDASHAEGVDTKASGGASHAEGHGTTASSNFQHVQGKYNIEDSSGAYLDIIGNGDADHRSNAATVDKQGNAWYAGDVYVGSTSGTNKDSGSKKLATKEYVDTVISSVSPGSLQRVVLFYDGTNIRLIDESQTVQTYESILSFSSSNAVSSVTLLRGQYIYHPLGLDLKNNIIFGRSYKDTDGRTVVSTIGISSENVVFCEDTYNVGVTTPDFGEIFGAYSGEKANSATAYGAHAEGGQTSASGTTSHAEGWATQASGDNSHAEGELTTASALDSHAEGKRTTASGDRSHAEGLSTIASGHSSHSEGEYSVASGLVSHAEGYETSAIGDNSHSEGLSTKANGPQSHAEGVSTVASGQTSHAEGDRTESQGHFSHSEGHATFAIGEDSHSEGFYTYAWGSHSHAEGSGTWAVGEGSHSEGIDTKATSSAQHVQGIRNIEDSEGVYLDIIGNGIDTDHRSNAATVDKQGNAWYAGNVYIGSTSGTNRDEGSKKLATEEYVNSAVNGSTLLSYSDLSDTSGEKVRVFLDDKGQHSTKSNTTNTLIIESVPGLKTIPTDPEGFYGMGSSEIVLRTSYTYPGGESPEYGTDILIKTSSGETKMLPRLSDSVYLGDSDNLWHGTYTRCLYTNVIDIPSGSGSEGIDFERSLLPRNNNISLGSNTRLWNCVYASNGVVQTSDRSFKDSIHYIEESSGTSEAVTFSLRNDSGLPAGTNTGDSSYISIEDVIDFVSLLSPATFCYKNGKDSAAEENSEPEAIQLGLIANDIKDHKLFKYVGVETTYEEEITPAVKDEEGNVVTEAVTETKTTLGLQAIPLATAALTACKYLIQKNEEIESRLSAIEDQLTALLNTNGN